MSLLSLFNELHLSGNLPTMGNFSNLIGNSMAVIRNLKPELVVVPFILDPEILCDDREECSFYSSDFSTKKYPPMTEVLLLQLKIFILKRRAFNVSHQKFVPCVDM
jgi:hypothetical protein